MSKRKPTQDEAVFEKAIDIGRRIVEKTFHKEPNCESTTGSDIRRLIKRLDSIHDTHILTSLLKRKARELEYVERVKVSYEVFLLLQAAGLGANVELNGIEFYTESDWYTSRGLPFPHIPFAMMPSGNLFTISKIHGMYPRIGVSVTCSKMPKDVFFPVACVTMFRLVDGGQSYGETAY